MLKSFMIPQNFESNGSKDDLQKAYDVFKAEDVEPEYPPSTVNTDG